MRPETRNRPSPASEPDGMSNRLSARSVWTRLAPMAVLAGAASAQVTIDRSLVEAAGGLPGLVTAARLEPAALDRLKGLRPGQHVTLRHVPLPDGAADLDLERFTVFEPGAVFAEGDRAAPEPDTVLLRGRLAHRPDSRVFLGLASTGVNGFILDAGRTWLVASPPPALDDPTLPIAIYEADRLPDAILNVSIPACGGAFSVPHEHAHAEASSGDAPETLPCRTVRVAIETDYELRQHMGSTTAVQNYVTTLMGAISEIYQREVNTVFTIPYLRTWNENTDPYTSTTVDNRLTEFRAHWNAQMGSVSRTIAHFITGIRSGSGGVAWVGSFCGSYAYGCSGHINGSFPYPLVHNHSNNWDLVVVSHEIGHNFNAPHTHSMTPQIDGCGSGNCANAATLGTIMSYCHTCSGGIRNIALNLHQRIIDERILPYLDGLSASCVARVDPPVIAAHPISLVRRAGQSATFNAAASGSGNTLQWRRNTVALTNGGRISGAMSTTLQIQNLTVADSGAYDMVATNSCGSATTDTAALTVRCAADWNLDGVTDFNDLLSYLNDFNAGSPQADLNADGVVDFNDLLVYLNSYNAPC